MKERFKKIVCNRINRIDPFDQSLPVIRVQKVLRGLDPVFYEIYKLCYGQANAGILQPLQYLFIQRNCAERLYGTAPIRFVWWSEI